MTRLLFDHQIFSSQRYGGISRYFANIYNYTQLEGAISSDISMIYSDNYYLEGNIGQLNNTIGKYFLNTREKIYKWNKKYSKYKIGKNDFDLFHPTYYDPYFIKKLKKPYVLTVHDMIYELYPNYFDPDNILPLYKKIAVNGAAKIIAISESTKQDLISILGVEESRINVVHHGISFTDIADCAPPFVEGKDYLLFVGERGLYKNFERFVTAISPLLSSNDQFRLICAGGGAFTLTEQELLKKLNVLGYVQQINTTDSQLASLYKGALAFVFPSIKEGFGFPLLEAFNNNCPIVASDTSCFREIGGDAVAYFDPFDEQSIITAIKSVIYDILRSNELRKNGALQLQKFSLERCMEKTISVYHSVL